MVTIEEAVDVGLGVEFRVFFADDLRCYLDYVVNHRRRGLEDFFYRKDDIPEDIFVK